MRHLIARALRAVLSVLLPAQGRRRQTAPQPMPTLTSPWAQPWPASSITKAEAAQVFRRRAEAAAQEERRHALDLATRGIDHPYSFDGAPFPAASFAMAGAAPAAGPVF